MRRVIPTRRAGARQRWIVILAALGATALMAAIAWQLVRSGDEWSGARWWDDWHRLPERMEIEQVVINLTANFDRSAVVTEAPEAPVYVGPVEPGFKLHVDARRRHAIVVPPPSHVRFRTRVPSGATLRFGAGVEGDGTRDRNTRGIRFSVHVDGHEQFARVINPAATRRDRRWFDATVDLGADVDREVDIALRTRAVGTGPRLGGTPGWSHVRIVRKQVRDRQLASQTDPNVLVLLVDTLRADRLGCYGASPSPSPVLDGLARDGLLFEQVVAQSAWTMPSVASIFTGLHPRSHGLVGGAKQAGDSRSMDGQQNIDPSLLSDSLPTMAVLAQLAGITTVGVSTNPLVSRGTNLARGFETFVEAGFEGRRQGWRSAREVNRVFLDWLSRNSGYRFLAYLHYMDAHGPYKPPEQYRPPPPEGIRPNVANGNVDRIAQKLHAEKGRALTTTELQYLRALYDADVQYWDAELALLLGGLSAAGVSESTVVVVTSDHGEEFLEHGRLKHGAHLYDELIRVPLVVNGPGIGPGRVEVQVQGIDLFPTVAGLLGVDAPHDLPGRSLLAAAPARRPAVSETSWGVASDGTGSKLLSLRTPDWKLIYSRATRSFELFDLNLDPSEHENRYGEVPEGAALERLLAEWEQTAPPPPPPVGSDPQFAEKLRALGYVE